MTDSTLEKLESMSDEEFAELRLVPRFLSINRFGF